ncbi:MULTISPECIES: hypothetical protein [unclassified Streptomyces]|uniref:hypothetical protein n=1 Tax=unclassified Streptomyces TaxID=2593676 RepID=UPI0035D77079
MTNTRKTTAPADATQGQAGEASETTAADTAPVNEPVLGPPLRAGQTAEKVTFAHHLRIAGRDFQPGDTATLSPDYARQLRSNGYIARGRA